jgi:hypothetical protein
MVIIRSPGRRIEIRNPAMRPRRLPAKIDTGLGSDLLHCLVEDISASGVQITLAAPADLPSKFVLLLTANGIVRRRCRVSARDGLELCVQFLPDRPDEHD